MPITSHKIQSGESLTSIARKYGFGDNYQPILNYNRSKKILITSNPNDIPAGKTVMIPRTREEYDEAIQSLESLLREVAKDMGKTLKELDTYKAEADRVGTHVDIAADIAFAAKGAVKASIKLGPRYAKYIIRKEAFDAAVSTAQKLAGMGDSNEELVVKNAGNAVVDQAVMIQAKRMFDAQKANSSFKAGMARSMAKKATVTSAKIVAPVEMANGVAEAVDILCDVALKAGSGAIKVMEAVAPSKVARQVVWFQSGEHPDDTHARMKRFVESTSQSTAKRLKDTITKLRKEKQEVYAPA